MLRFALIGTNWITDRWVEAAGLLDGVEITAVYSRTEERAREYAQKIGVRTMFTDLQEMAHSAVYDAVYIASPNAMHANQAILLMNAGKHVLCEKPMASNRAEVDAMIRAAQVNRVLLMEAMKTTLTPGFCTIREHLPKLGTIRRYAASFCKYSSRYDAYLNGQVRNAFKPELSNGSLMDLGVYCLYPLVVLFGKPKRVHASAVMLASGVDGEGSLLLEYEGMEAVLMHSKISNSALPSEIQGEEGCMVIDHIAEPGHIEICYRDGSRETLSFAQNEPSMLYEVQEFIRCVANGQLESETNSHARAQLTASIMEQAREQFGLSYPADRG